MVKDIIPNRINMLFAYENVLKSPDVFILKKMAGDYRDRFEGFIDFELIDLNTPDALMVQVVNRDVKNPIEWLAKENFDYDKIYHQLHQGFSNMYRDSDRLILFDRLYTLAKSYIVNRIYIWLPEYDKRIHYDLDEILHDEKVELAVNKDLENVINDIGDLNFVYDWDIDRLYRIINTEKHNDIFFGIAGYPFNFDKETRKLKYNLYQRSNIAFYPVYNMNETNKYNG